MTRRRTGGTREWRGLLAQTLGKHRLSRGVERARAVLVWPEVVGADLARLTRARSQGRGILFVEAHDSVLANFLTMQRHVFLARLQEKLGDDSVTELRFSVGTWDEAPVAPPPEPLPPPDRARAARTVERVPENVRDSALKAAEAITRARLWRERQGWPACPVCGTPVKTAPCLPCRTLLADAQVGAASRRLARAPEELPDVAARLGDDAASAARLLALEALGAQLELLALECAAAGGEEAYRGFLQAQAEIWLALHARKPRAQLRRADWSALPERPRRVLDAGRRGS